MRRLLTIAALGLAAFGATAATGTADAHAASIRECGNMPRYLVSNITTRGVPCYRARSTAARFVLGDRPAGRIRVRSYSRGAYLIQDVRMTWFGLVIHFQRKVAD